MVAKDTFCKASRPNSCQRLLSMASNSSRMTVSRNPTGRSMCSPLTLLTSFGQRLRKLRIIFRKPRPHWWKTHRILTLKLLSTMVCNPVFQECKMLMYTFLYSNPIAMILAMGGNLTLGLGGQKV